MRKRVADDPRIPEAAKSYGVAASERVYWNRRNSRGQFVSWDGSTGSPEYAAYLEARMDDAERATKGNLVNPAGREKWVFPDDIMRAGGGMRHATDELRGWLEIHGRTLSFREFRRQSVESSRS